MIARAPKADWIAVDWGTTHLRAWSMRADGEVLDRAGSDDGMGALARDGFEPALLRLVTPWLGAGITRIVACGMVGARQGWAEAPYRAAPCAAAGAALVKAPSRDPRLDVRLVPGVRQDRPADVMRGEETQIAGFLTANPGFDGVLCLPGTHTKWVRISAAEIVGFRTFMTGELFSVLSRHSVLRHTVAEDGWDDAAFAGALDEALAKPADMAARLFGLRAEGLLHGLAGAAARARLSGLLVGTELAAARSWWLGQDLALIGAPALTAIYAGALARQGAASAVVDGERMTLAGLAAAHATLKETT